MCGSFGDLVVPLCFGDWIDVGVYFSFGGVVSLLVFWDNLDAGLFW